MSQRTKINPTQGESAAQRTQRSSSASAASTTAPSSTSATASRSSSSSPSPSSTPGSARSPSPSPSPNASKSPPASASGVNSPTSESSSSSTAATTTTTTTSHITYTPEYGIYVSTLAGIPPPPLIPVKSAPSASSAAAGDHALSPTSSTPSSTSSSDADDDDHDDDDDDDDDDENDSKSSSRSKSKKPRPLTSTKFFHPSSICPSRDSKHLLVCDSHSLRHINTVKKLVGTLSSSVQNCGIFRDCHGNILICDTQMNCIKKITAEKGEFVHLAGSTKGAAGYVNATTNQARFNGPTAICGNGVENGSSSSTDKSSSSHPSSSLYFVCDTGNHCIRAVTEKGIVSTLAGAPPEKLIPGSSSSSAASSSTSKSVLARPCSSPPPVNSPTSKKSPVVVDGPIDIATFISPVGCTFSHADQSLVICDAGAHSIRRITLAGLVWTIAGSTYGESGFIDGAAYLARFHHPTSVAVDSLQRIWITDRMNHSVRLITPTGFVHTIAGTGHQGYRNGSGHLVQFNSPCGISLDNAGSVYIADSNNHLIRRIQFITLPVIQRDIGDTHTVLLKYYSEFRDRQQQKQAVSELKIVKLERQLMEVKMELNEEKKKTKEEFVKLRNEQMQMQMQLLASMQNMMK